MNNNYEINKSRVQQFGLSTTIKDDDGKEHYFYRGHEYVEIGGLKWAVTNVGSNTETDSGLYFAFGETKGYTADQVRRDERKFNENEYTDVNFDAVNVYWGGKWRLPTREEFYVLISATTNEWVESYQGSEVSGRLFTDKTDSLKKLFFPAVGYCINGTAYRIVPTSYYWSSSLNNNNFGIALDFSNWHTNITPYNRFIGFSIRGVIGE